MDGSDNVEMIRHHVNEAYWSESSTQFFNNLNYRQGKYTSHDGECRMISQPPVTLQNLVTRILSAIYWEFRRYGGPRKSSTIYPMHHEHFVDLYDLHCLSDIQLSSIADPQASHFLNQALSLVPEFDDSHAIFRCYRLVTELGWGLFAVLAYSDTFFLASRILKEPSWDELCSLIRKNKASLYLFGVRHGLSWRAFCDSVSQGNSHQPRGIDLALPFDDSKYDPLLGIVPVLCLNGTVDVARFDGQDMVDIKENELGQDEWEVSELPTDYMQWTDDEEWPVNPLKFTDRDRREGIECIACRRVVNRHNPCACTPADCCYQPLCEIVEGIYGRGVRVLEDVPAFVALDEYSGLVVPSGWQGDTVYSMRADTFRNTIPSQNNECFKRVAFELHAKKVGNWTRFMNHSCSAHASFTDAFPIGHSYRQLITMQGRDAQAFTELSIDYGNEYFDYSRLCLCKSPECVASTRKQALFNNTLRMVREWDRHVTLKDWSVFSRDEKKKHLEMAIFHARSTTRQFWKIDLHSALEQTFRSYPECRLDMFDILEDDEELDGLDALIDGMDTMAV
ncbi:MAG: hypothetical protein M1814_004657 [Vezdaea aestivalis]|nr:MAG: hypothetical protein M1814_004657 [Vezdaea aestivalis]